MNLVCVPRQARFIISLLCGLFGVCFSAYSTGFKHQLIEVVGAESSFVLTVENNSNIDDDWTLVLAVKKNGVVKYSNLSKKVCCEKKMELSISRENSKLNIYLGSALVYKIEEGVFQDTGEIIGMGEMPWSERFEYRYVEQDNVLFYNKNIFIKNWGRVCCGKAAIGFYKPPLIKLKSDFEWDRISTVFSIKIQKSIRKNYVDMYGQFTRGSWGDKIKNNGDLEKHFVDEAVFNDSLKNDGKNNSSKIKGSGFYRVEKINNVWWLVSPKGDLVFYKGVNSVPSKYWPATPVTNREYLFENLDLKNNKALKKDIWGKGEATEYYSFVAANLMKKYGEFWEDLVVGLTKNRLDKWGFDGAGKWGRLSDVPYFPAISRDNVPKIINHPDIFDKEVQNIFDLKIKEQIAGRENDPDIVGWSLGNEISEIILLKDIDLIFKKNGCFPLKNALLEYVALLMDQERTGSGSTIRAQGCNAKPSHSYYEKARQYYAKSYYSFIYKTVKKYDSNHLYFGFWIVPGWWENENDWKMIEENVDVVGYDRYAKNYSGREIDRLVADSSKPVFVGEFSFPPFYYGERGFGIYHGMVIDDDKHAGELYQNWAFSAAKDPKCVGMNWFEYRDQPITGRGPEKQGAGFVIGENFAFGLVDVADTPKWDLIRVMASVNKRVNSYRFENAK